MVTTPTQTHPKFTDTYWIIPEYSTTPYGKVSFTRQDRRIFTDNSIDFIKNPLLVLANFAYSNHALVNPSDRFRSLDWYKATIDAEDSVFFYVVDNALQHSMVALLGQSSDWLVSLYASTANPDNVTANYEFRSSSGDFLNKYKEIASMATIPSQTHPKFTDTYWVIPLDSSVPYGKVSLTRQDRHIFTDDSVDFIKNPLPILANFAYSNHALVNPSDRFGTLNIRKATVDAKDSVFFYVVDNALNALQHSMVALLGQSSDWLVSLRTSSSNPDSVTAHKEIGTSSGDFLNKRKEIASMATIPSQTHPKFTDTYWIIPEYSTTPYGKVSFTRQDRHIFTDDSVDFIKNPLPVLANFAYSNHALVNPSDRFRSLDIRKATIDAEDSVFFYVVDNALQHSMVALLGQSSDWLVSLRTSTANPDNVTANYEFRSSSGDFLNKRKEIAPMATIPSQTHPKFTDTYWIIPLDSALPYGKVSFTRRDFRTFNSMFKDSRLIWAGRKPVHASMEGN